MMVADCGISKSLSIDAKRRNARLMAAAPVMLELLEGDDRAKTIRAFIEG
jgi:hypothetical protein